MRLARLAVAGLGVGLFVGFAAALLRPRAHALFDEPQTVGPHVGPPTGIPVSQDAFDAFGPAPRDPTNPRPDPVTPDRPSAPAAGPVDLTDASHTSAADARRLDR